jgi:hypothetical protein
MLLVRLGVSAAELLKFFTLAVAEFMLLAKLHIATAAAAITAIPTPVSAKKVAVLMFNALAAMVAAPQAAE